MPHRLGHECEEREVVLCFCVCLCLPCFPFLALMASGDNPFVIVSF